MPAKAWTNAFVTQLLIYAVQIKYAGHEIKLDKISQEAYKNIDYVINYSMLHLTDI